MLYFAYGSNLDPRQMSERCPGHGVAGLAALHDYRLGFPLRSDRWGGGTAGPLHAHGQTVWGIVYDIGEKDLAALDSHEGCQGPGNPHNLYDRELVTVDLVRTDDGSVPRRVRAWVYVARVIHPAPPSSRYLETLLRGARHHRLPEDYIEQLETIEPMDESA